MANLKLLCVATALLMMVFHITKAAELHACKGGDKKCVIEMLEAILQTQAKGNREWNLVPFDPLQINSMILERNPSSPVNMDLKFKNIEMTGISNVKIEKVVGFDADPKTSSFEIYGLVPKLSITGPYTIDGKVLILPIKGEGDCKITFENIKLAMKIATNTIEKDGKTYLHIENIKLDLDPSNGKFNFKQLFNGDKTLGDNTNKFINENWLEIFNELKPAITKALDLIIGNVVNGVLTKYPYENMILAA